MKRVDFLVIGGSAAGTTAAETIRGLVPNAKIAIVTDEAHEQYSRVLLPHYVRHKITRDQMFLKKPEWYLEKKIELIKREKAIGLDAKSKRVRVSSGKEITYGKLLITIGGYVVPLTVPGAESEEVLYMRTVEDGDKIIEKSQGAKKAVIIGGGFIGLEFSSCFRYNGIDEVITLVRDPYYWSKKLDEESSRVVVGILERNDVFVKTGEETDHLETKGGKMSAVVTKSGNRYEVDVVGVGIGIKSDFSWLLGSGVEVAKGIVTNEYLETNVADIYAAGDCAEFYDPVFERTHLVGNWSNATSQGAAVGKTMAGQRIMFETASSYSISFFDPPNSGACSFIGVCDSEFATEVVSRGSASENKVTRIFLKPYNGKMRIVGATVVNNPADVSPLTLTVKNKIDISSHKDNLGKSDFDLKRLLNS